MGNGLRVFTIGVYGFTEETFFGALTASKVDTFCDIRRRRGLRGSEYTFANSQRLQERLGVLGVRYLHMKQLAPSNATRALQKDEDERSGTRKRDRATLSPAFVAAYRMECLGGFSAERFLGDIGPDARVLALFCVEREPAACHRSLVAQELGSRISVTPEHLLP